MEQIYNSKITELGYTNKVCDIFSDWENVKDEILPEDRKQGTGKGTIHVFLGKADLSLREEFKDYYASVNNEADSLEGAIKIKHFFLQSNILSLLGYVCKYYYDQNKYEQISIEKLLDTLSEFRSNDGLLTTESLFKLSTGSNKLRPYFKQFDSNGVFHRLIRKMLLPNSAYKIALYKNSNNEYAAFWLIGFPDSTDFDVNANRELLIEGNLEKDNVAQELQQIFYGAPGTGKSHIVKKKTMNESVIRTTFHPDSDYSTFVGSYKPTVKEVPIRDVTGKTIQENGKIVTEEHIVYEFVKQSFLQAYVKSWEYFFEAEVNAKPQKQFLIIEEINRGNCAQIFGDLFQLLDRNDYGFSDYPIKADSDLQKRLAKDFAKYTNKNIEDKINYINNLYNKEVGLGVIKGDILLLPSNFYIWATMNTSDQSLFPIDSAFKRRWSWQYTPIAKGRSLNGQDLSWCISIGDKEYSWWSFLEKINEQIGESTQSEDKKLGYFFCKAINGKISSDVFVGKVIFYLWNDVFKDYGLDGSVFKDSDGTPLSFNKFYTNDETGEIIVNDEKIKIFLNNLGVQFTTENEQDLETENNTSL